MKLTEENRPIIAAMNRAYTEGGRPGLGWNKSQVEFATEYFLKLINGTFIDLPSGRENKIPDNIPLDVRIDSALISFTDFTFNGWEFLFSKDEYIPDNTLKNIAKTLVSMIQKTDFNYRNTASSAITLLTCMKRELVLPSAKGTWLTDHNFYPTIEYDRDITNRVLIPEAITYAKANSPYLK